jgi:pimeloyl-ACP methyl ester carboxylesterase
MHAVREGVGRPLLLVHGLGSSHRNWDRVLPALSAQREVVAVDLPGFGWTPPLSGEVSIASLTDAFPSQADRALRLFPDAALHWFSDCGHFPHWDQPEETVALILDACTSATTGA